MIVGTVRQRGADWFVEHSYSLHSEPALAIVSWKVIGSRRTGGLAPDLVDGLRLDSVSDQDRWQAYRQGEYLTLFTEHQGTIRKEPLPCPKVRRGIETRYRDGQWERYLKMEGWVRA